MSSILFQRSKFCKNMESSKAKFFKPVKPILSADRSCHSNIFHTEISCFTSIWERSALSCVSLSSAICADLTAPSVEFVNLKASWFKGKAATGNTNGIPLEEIFLTEFSESKNTIDPIEFL